MITVTASDLPDDELVTAWELVTEGIARTQQRVVEQIEASGVPAQWFATLHLLLRADAHRLPMNRLAHELSMTTGGFTKLADRLAREGLIDRRGSAGDRRVVYATLTADGLRTARRTATLYHRGLREHVLRVLDAVRLAELAELTRVLAEAHRPPGDHDEQVPTPRDPNLPERRAALRHLRERGGSGIRTRDGL